MLHHTSNMLQINNVSKATESSHKLRSEHTHTPIHVHRGIWHELTFSWISNLFVINSMLFNMQTLLFLDCVWKQRGGEILTGVDVADVSETFQSSCRNVFPPHEEAKAAQPLAGPDRVTWPKIHVIRTRPRLVVISTPPTLTCCNRSQAKHRPRCPSPTSRASSSSSPRIPPAPLHPASCERWCLLPSSVCILAGSGDKLRATRAQTQRRTQVFK